MKDKEGSNAEDVLAQLNNSRTSETLLKSLYSKLNRDNLSNYQRNRILKTIALQCSKDGTSTDLRITALAAGLSLIQSDLSSSSNVTSGATYALLEVCLQLVIEYGQSTNSYQFDMTEKALEILTLVNSATASKLLMGTNGKTFMKVLCSCAKVPKLKLLSLKLLAIARSVPKSEAFGEAFSEEESTLLFIKLVYPLIFNLEDADIQREALNLLRGGVKLSPKPQPFWNNLKEETQKIHCKRLVEMVNAKANWPEAWQFVVNLFGEELHSGGQLINHMLEVLERAFKHSDFEWTRVQAFECWNTLIENFKNGLKNRKRIDLIMIPLKANNHRIETLAVAKLKTYDHLLKTLGEDLTTSPDILLNFLSFCFGSDKTTCLPVKSYPALHKRCAERLRDILVSPYSDKLFPKAHKELISAVGDCFLMDNVPSDLLTEIWNRLLDFTQNEGTDAVKTLLNMVNTLVTHAGSGDPNANLKVRRTMSPPSVPAVPHQPNAVLGSKIVTIIVHGLLHGEFALKRSLLINRSLYIGLYDVMNGTPSLLLIEWLLSPALMLGASGSDDYMKLLLKLINIHRIELSGFIDFAQLILKKLLAFDDSLNLNKKVLLYKYTAGVWCTLAQEIVQFTCSQGSINQGDAAEHDFRSLYSVLMFPIQNLHSNFELIETCKQPWNELFYEASQQAELLPTASLQLLCEQVCIRLCGFSKRNNSSKQHAAVYFFLSCILEVTCTKLKSKKSIRWVNHHISSVIKELNDITIDQELVLNQAVSCIQHCLKINAVTPEVIENVTPSICLLLKSNISNYDPVDKLCTLLEVLKEASLSVHEHGSTKETVIGVLQNVINVGESLSSQKLRSAIRELSEAFNVKKRKDEEKSQITSKAAFSPTNRISFSPKSASKKFPTIQMSPSNLSSGGAKRKLQASVCGSDGKFVRIETPPKKIILTEHQKEVRRERRQDIPALYQDLSQDTQSMSQDATQDFAPLPVTPKGKSNIVVDEDALMDAVDVDSSIQVLCVKKVESPKVVKKGEVSLEVKTERSCFTPPAGFVLPSAPSDAPVADSKNANQEQTLDFNQEVHPGKENEDISDKGTRTSRNGAITRSSLSSSTTRSGKVLKRNSLLPEPELSKLRKSARKSLPINCPEEGLKKNVVETVVIESDTTDSESISSIASDVSITKSKKTPLLRSRRSLRKETSFESESLQVVEKKTVGNKSSLEDTDSSKTEEGMLRSEHRPKSDASDDLPLAKVFGGKILTRSRSNSSLDEVVTQGKKPKNPSPDRKGRVMSPITESIASSGELSDKTSLKSPGKNGCVRENSENDTNGKSKSEGSPIGKRGNNSDVSCDVSVQHNSMNKLFCGAASNNVSTKSAGKRAVSPNSPEIAQNIPSECENGISREEVTKAGVSTSPPVSQPSDELSGHKRNGSSPNNQFENGSEESQEIIESSQDPIVKLKPCLVSLEQFRCDDPNEKVEISSVVVEKGPDATSPYKVHPKEQTETSTVKVAVCRRSLMLDAEKVLPSGILSSPPKAKPIVGTPPKAKPIVGTPPKAKPIVSSPPKEKPIDDVKSESPNSDKDTSTKDSKSSTFDTSKKISILVNQESEEISKVTHNKEGKEESSSSSGVVIPQSRNDSMPEWMHDKKNSPLSKASRTIRNASARSQAFMKSVTDVGFSCSPPKGIDVSPISSPVQPKKLQKTGMDPNTTPIIKRPSRAAQLLGLGQAAAARGGETVVSSSPRPARVEKTNENEEVEASGNNTSSVPSTSSGCPSTAGAVTSTILNTVSTTSAAVASPSVRRQGRLLDLDSMKSTPQKCLEDRGLKEDWVPKDPRAKATPDSSILKRKREVDSDAPSPNLKRKRVSFRDPPLSKMLRFGETCEAPGTVFSSGQSSGSEKVAANSECDSKDCNEDSSRSPKRKHLRESEPLSASLSTLNGGDNAISICSPQRNDKKLQPSESPIKRHENVLSPEKSDSTKSKGLVSGENDLEVKSSAEITSETEKPNEGLQCSPNSRRKSSRNSVFKIGGQLEREPSSTSEKNGTSSENDMSDVDGVDKLPEEGCQQSEVETQGMLDDLHRIPSSLSPIYVGLLDCTHSIDRITSKLTSAAWERSLLRELGESKIHTVGDLAKLSEEQLDHLRVKPPKRTNVFCVLEDFDKVHSTLKDGFNCKLSKSSRLSPVKSKSSLEDILANSSPEEILKALSNLGRKSEFCEAAIHFLEPKEVISALKPEDLMCSIKPVDFINSLQPELVATIIGSNQNILKSISADVGAEIYISQVGKSSGKKEKTMSVEDLSAILSRAPGRIIQNTMFPSVPSILSSVYTDMMRDYILRECEISDIVPQLNDSKAEEFAIRLIPKLSASVLAEKIDSTKAKEIAVELLPKLKPSVIVSNLDVSKAEEIGIKLLPKLSSSVLVQEIDSAKATELITTLLSQMSSSDIAELIEDGKCEGVIKALLSKFDVKKSLEFLLQNSLKVVKKLP